jgi:hypothetical protein
MQDVALLDGSDVRPLPEKESIVQLNDELLSTFDFCDHYLEVQMQLGLLVKKGFMQLALAKKGSRLATIDDCRSEFSPSVKVNVSIENSVPVFSVAAVDDLTKSTADDAAYYFSGLPHRMLRFSQKNFLSALREVILATNHLQRISAQLKKVEKISTS